MYHILDSTSIIHISFLFFYTALSYGLILFNDGLYWDAWMVDSWQRRKDWSTMKRYLSEVGMPVMYYVYKLNSLFPNRIFASKLLAFVSIFISSVQIYFITTYFNFLKPDQALLLALLFLSYTGYHMMVDTVVGLQYTFPISVFYTAVFLALYANTHSGPVSIITYILAHILFFWSFNANSILVYYFGFLGLNIFSQVNWKFIQIFSSEIIINNISYVSIPFIYWFIKEKFTPRHGHCVEYNKISIDISNIIRGLFYSIRFALESAIVMPVLFMIRNKFILITLLFIIFFNSFVTLDIRVDDSVSMILVIVGIIFFFLAVIPYILVGQPINDNGWATKNAMLIHLPSGMIIMGTFSILITESILFQSVMIFYLISTCLYNIRTELYYLAVFMKDYSWLYKLKNNTEMTDVKIFQLVDKHSIKGDFTNKYQDYKPVYIHFMLDWIWGKTPNRFGISKFEPQKSFTQSELREAFESTTIPYALNYIDINSRQVRITIKNNNTRPFYIHALKYIKARYFRKNEMQSVLENMTQIDVEFIDN
jgi:hypothetical protein